MKTKLNNIIAFVLAFAIILSGIQINYVEGSETTPQIEVGSVTCKKDAIIEVPVYLKNNPGITAISYDIAYNDDVMELKSINNENLLSGALYTSSSSLEENPQRVIWVIGTSNSSQNGKMLILQFKVKPGIEAGDYPITLSYDAEDIYDTALNNVSFDIINGVISVKNRIPGDVSGDGKVNTKDATLILQYLVGTYTDIDKITADVTGDGKVNSKDATVIIQYYAGWDVKLECIEPTAEPTAVPTATPVPTAVPTVVPTPTPTAVPTATPEPTETPTPEPTATPVPTEVPTAEPTPVPTEVPAEPITYDAETDTFTMHGTGTTFDSSKPTNGSYKLSNPFAGLSLNEALTLGGDGYPVWNNGVTISYWVNVPADAKDALLLKFELENQQMMYPDDQYKYELCHAYTEEDATYSMGTVETYVSIADDGTETEYSVLSGYGNNVRYNPNYPSEGLYTVDASKGTIDVIKKGVDASVTENWTKIKAIGAGYYETYSVRYTDEGGEVSAIREGKVTSQLHLYASGSFEFFGDDYSGLQENPNAGNYNSSLGAARNNMLMMWANNAPLTAYSTPSYDGALTSTLVSQLDQWHFVVVKITNDCIQYYVDGEKLSAYNYNWWGVYMSKVAKNFKAFNKGYGLKDFWITTNPAVYRTYGKTLMEIITDPNTTLEIGGQNLGSNYSGMSNIGTPEGVQIKELKFYGEAVADENITADAVIDTESLDYIKSIPLTEEVKTLNNATVDINGVYTFTEPVAAETGYTYVSGGSEKTIDAYYGIELNNPFAGNTAVRQEWSEILSDEQLVFKGTTAGTSTALQQKWGSYGDVWYGNINATLTDEEYDSTIGDKTVATDFYRPTWTKGASVSFWFKPNQATMDTLAEGNYDAIYSMFDEGNFVFMLAADGSLTWQDLSVKEWGGNPKTVFSSRNGNSRNQFTVLGDVSKVKVNEWNHYTVTFANDWIQVYINGQEVKYQNVCFTRTYYRDFNGGFMTRYNNIGQIFADTDEHQYMTMSGGISTEGADNDDTAIRATGVYNKGYNVQTTTSQGEQYKLLLDALTSETAVAYIGGCPSPMNNTAKGTTRHIGNAVRGAFSMEHNLTAGNAYTGFTFVAKELTASEAAEVYSNAVVPQ